jgi:D-cysteine desulfhydrase family pyridoxal phosphate-dependent enzyme
MTRAELPRLRLAGLPTPLERAPRFGEAIGAEVWIKRDDVGSIGLAGNKVRKLEYVLAQARAFGADTLVTLGGLQSNHARATAAAAAKMGMRCVLIINGAPQDRPTANALLDRLLGAEIEYIPSRNERAEASDRVMARLRDEGRNPYFLPLGASTPTGAFGFVAAIGELVGQGVVPDVIVHACSSGGTQAGLIAGTTLYGLNTRVIGVSADDPASSIISTVRRIVRGTDGLDAFDEPIEVDDTRVGDGYGVPTAESIEAQTLAARTEALFVDHTYTAKAFGAFVSYVREGRFDTDEVVLFWHTGGQVGLFA